MFLYTQGGFLERERENISQKQLAVCRFCRIAPECSNSSLLNFYNPQFSTNAAVVDSPGRSGFPARTELLSWLNGSFQCLGFEVWEAIFEKPKKKCGEEKGNPPPKSGLQMGVSKNRSTPKWMVYNGKPY